MSTVDFRLSSNQLEGTIPEELYSLEFLFRFVVDSNSIGGTLSTQVGRLVRLQQLRVSRNQMTGSLPVQIASIQTMRLLWLHLNLFTGSVPVQYCNNVGPGFLQFLNADCGPETNPTQPCICCTGCCDRVTGVCLRQA